MEKTKEIEQVTASEIVLYSLSETVDIEVHIAEESVWLTQAQIALLFDVKEHTITYHIKEIYRIQELLPLATTRKFRVVRKEGGRTVSRWLDFYNLDMILSIGYRVNTISGIRFRQWASQILKEYMLNGYTLNPEMNVINQRLAKHDRDILSLNQRIDGLVQTALPPRFGLFFNGQTFDAYTFVANLVKSAKTDIKLVDNFIDESVLHLLDKRHAHISASIYTEHISPQLQSDLSKHNSQYPSISVARIEKVHDRLLLIDHTGLFHFGASFKDLGKKLFLVSKIEEPVIVDKINELLNSEL